MLAAAGAAAAVIVFPAMGAGRAAATGSCCLAGRTGAERSEQAGQRAGDRPTQESPAIDAIGESDDH